MKPAIILEAIIQAFFISLILPSLGSALTMMQSHPATCLASIYVIAFVLLLRHKRSTANQKFKPTFKPCWRCNYHAESEPHACNVRPERECVCCEECTGNCEWYKPDANS